MAILPGVTLRVALPIDGDAHLVQKAALTSGEVELQPHKPPVLDFGTGHSGGAVLFRDVALTRGQDLAGDYAQVLRSVEKAFRHDDLRDASRAQPAEIVPAADRAGGAVRIFDGARRGLAAVAYGRLDNDFVRPGIEGEEVALDGEAAVGAARADRPLAWAAVRCKDTRVHSSRRKSPGSGPTSRTAPLRGACGGSGR